MSRMRIVAAVTLLAAFMAWAPGAMAQAKPTLSTSPARPNPGDQVTVTVDDCPIQPEVQYAIRDTVQLFTLTATSEPDQWQIKMPADVIDGGVGGRCGDVELDPVIIDVENPLLSFLPQGAFLPTPNPPTTVYGTDCPDGSLVLVGRVIDGLPATQIQGPPLDEQGDWSTPLGSYPPGSTVVVSADCGDVVYRSLTFTVPDGTSAETSTTSTSTVTVPPVDPSQPPPAQPRPGSANFTG